MGDLTKDAMRKPGHSKLVYDKSSRTIVAQQKDGSVFIPHEKLKFERDQLRADLAERDARIEKLIAEDVVSLARAIDGMDKRDKVIAELVEGLKELAGLSVFNNFHPETDGGKTLATARALLAKHSAPAAETTEGERRKPKRDGPFDKWHIVDFGDEHPDPRSERPEADHDQK